MFIRVRRNNTPVLLALSEIALVEPFDGGKKVSIKSTGGSWYFWDCTLDQAQDALIDCAAQVTAPIASRITGLDNTVARLARSMEDWLEKADTPILSPEPLVVDLGSSPLEEELKQAARYRWLKKHARQEGRDGGYSQIVTFPHVDISDGRTFNHRTLDAAIDAVIKSEKRTCEKE